MSAAKKGLAVFASAIALFAMTVFLLSPGHYAECVKTGISLWAASVLPATFPFLFLTALLTSLRPFAVFSRKLSPLTGKIFRVSGAGGGAAILSALSGYPVGARMVCDLSAKRIPKGEIFRLACLCSTSGPMFLVGTVGCMMYDSAGAGWILLFSHLSAVWLVCFFLRFTAGPVVNAVLPALPEQNTNALSDSLWNAVVSVLCVGGFIALFSCFAEMLSDLRLFTAISACFGGSAYAEGVCRGLLEMTTGCAFLSAYRTPLSLAFSAGLVTFGGTCVLCQQMTFLTKAGVKTLPFLGVKLLQAVLAFSICWILSSLLPVTV